MPSPEIPGIFKGDDMNLKLAALALSLIVLNTLPWVLGDDPASSSSTVENVTMNGPDMMNSEVINSQMDPEFPVIIGGNGIDII